MPSRRDRDEMSRVLTDAATIGDEKAAQKHGISLRTLYRYRSVANGDSELTAAVLEKKRALSEGWLVEAKKARMKALARGLQLAETSDNLRDVTGFLKIVHDAVLADEMLNGEPPEPTHELDRPSDGVEGQAVASGEVQGGTATTH